MHLRRAGAVPKERSVGELDEKFNPHSMIQV